MLNGIHNYLLVRLRSIFFCSYWSQHLYHVRGYEKVIGLRREENKTKEWGKGVWKVGGEKGPQHSF